MAIKNRNWNKNIEKILKKHKKRHGLEVNYDYIFVNSAKRIVFSPPRRAIWEHGQFIRSNSVEQFTKVKTKQLFQI